MNIKTFLFLAIINSVAFGCGKKEDPNPTPPRKDMFYLPQDAHDYFNYQVGEKRVYLDSLSGETDTLTCEEVDRFILRNVYGEIFLFNEEAFIIIQRSSKERVLYVHKSKFQLFDDGREEFLIEEVNITWGTSDFQKLPFVLNRQINDSWGAGTSTVQSFFPSITIAGKTFQNVYKLVRTKVESRRAADVDCYYGKGKGLVAIKNYTTNKFWVLQEIL